MRVGCVNSVAADLQGDSGFAANPYWAAGSVLETTSGSQSAGPVKSRYAQADPTAGPNPVWAPRPRFGPTDAGKGTVSPDRPAGRVRKPVRS